MCVWVGKRMVLAWEPLHLEYFNLRTRLATHNQTLNHG